MDAHISAPALADLIQHQIGRADAAGVKHIRHPDAFQMHLLSAAQRARAVACRLCEILPPDEAPDPVAAFVAGGWHDAGKIWNGDDYHEITSALEVLDHGMEWGLVNTSGPDAAGLLRRAARALLPHFAIYEQCRAEYVPTTRQQAWFAPLLARLAEALSPSGDCRRFMLPGTVDALVVMYSDMTSGVRRDETMPFERAFERRWRDVQRDAGSDDPGILPLLPVVRSRIETGCALIDQFLSRGYDAEALRRFRARYVDREHNMPAGSTAAG